MSVYKWRSGLRGDAVIYRRRTWGHGRANALEVAEGVHGHLHVLLFGELSESFFSLELEKRCQTNKQKMVSDQQILSLCMQLRQ